MKTVKLFPGDTAIIIGVSFRVDRTVTLFLSHLQRIGLFGGARLAAMLFIVE